MHSRSSGELGTGKEETRHCLGKVEEGLGRHTVEGIGRRWPGVGDRRGSAVSV